MSYLNQKPFQFWIFIAILTLAFIWLFKGIMLPFVVGMVVAYLLNPVVEKMEGRRIPRWLSALVILGVFFLTVIIGLLLAVPLLIREMADFIRMLPDIFRTFQDWLASTVTFIDIPRSVDVDPQEAVDKALASDQLGGVLEASKNFLGNILQGGMAVISFLTFLILVPIVAFYLMIDWPRLVRYVQSLIPETSMPRARVIFRDIDSSLSGFIRGQLTVCFLLGGFYAIALALIGLDYGFFVGIASGILSIIPYVGSTFGLVASVGLAFYQFGGWTYPLIALAIFVVGQLVEGNYLTPKLVGGNVGLHPLWVIFVLLAGGALLGLLGMIIAVPVAAIIAVLLRYVIADYKASSYYKARIPKTAKNKK